MVTQQFLPSCDLQLLTIAVLTGPLLTLASFLSPPGPQQQNQMLFELLPLNNVLFSQNLLLEVSARSQIDCSKKCVETEGCVMCTFHSSPEGPSLPGLCRLHSQLQKDTDDKREKVGARSMVRIRPCAEGFVQTCGQCLKAVKNPVNYTTARDKCHQRQAQLVMPKSRAQAACVSSFLRANDLGAIWVGADDLLTPGAFRWSDGALLEDSSLLWNIMTSDPHHGSPGADCVFLPVDPIRLQDQGCFYMFDYVCVCVSKGRNSISSG